MQPFRFKKLSEFPIPKSSSPRAGRAAMRNHGSGGHCSAVNQRCQNPEQVSDAAAPAAPGPGKENAAATTGSSLQLPFPCHYQLNHGVMACPVLERIHRDHPVQLQGQPSAATPGSWSSGTACSSENHPGNYFCSSPPVPGSRGEGEGSSSTKERGRGA